MTNKTRKWLRGGIEVLIHGGTSALIAAIVSTMQHKKNFSWSAFWTLVGFQFLGNGGLRFLQWWNNNPLPPEDDSGLAQSTISLSPISKVHPANQVTNTTPLTPVPVGTTVAP